MTVEDAEKVVRLFAQYVRGLITQDEFIAQIAEMALEAMVS